MAIIGCCLLLFDDYDNVAYVGTALRVHLMPFQAHRENVLVSNGLLGAFTLAPATTVQPYSTPHIEIMLELLLVLSTLRTAWI